MARPEIPTISGRVAPIRPPRPMPGELVPNYCPGSNIISSPNIVNLGRRGRIGSKNKRLDCCYFRCFSCLHVEFLKRTPGILKLSEAILGSLCQWLLLDFGNSYASEIGEAYNEFLISTSFCLINTFLLLACYILSRNTYHLIRSSIYETAFNTLACISYICSSSYLAYSVNTKLYIKYLILPFYQVFPALTGAYVLGFVAGFVHFYDAFLNYKRIIR